MSGDKDVQMQDLSTTNGSNSLQRSQSHEEDNLDLMIDNETSNSLNSLHILKDNENPNPNSILQAPITGKDLLFDHQSPSSSLLDRWIEKVAKCEVLSEEEVEKLCDMAREVLNKEDNVQHVALPVTICGGNTIKKTISGIGGRCEKGARID